MESKEEYFFSFFWIEHKNGKNVNSGTAHYKSRLKSPFPDLIKAFVRSEIIKNPFAVITYHNVAPVSEQVYLYEINKQRS